MEDIINAVNVHEEANYKAFLFRNRENRPFIIAFIASFLLQIITLKIIHPLPNFINDDSFAYLQTAYHNLPINYYLIGYSMFLRVLSVFTTSAIATVFMQYLLLEISSFYVFSTICFFVNLGKSWKWILLVFTCINPLLLFLGNLISSDGLFVTLSLFWIGSLFWLSIKPSLYIYLFHAAILFLCFTVRYNSIFYVFISSTVIAASNHKRWIKSVLILSMCIPIGLFIYNTEKEYHKISNQWQFSPFAGWLLSNNALYAYRYVNSDERDIPPVKFSMVDSMVRKYFDTTSNKKSHPLETMMASTYYMWSKNMPLWDYEEKALRHDTISDNFSKWAMMGPFYKDYGAYLIRHYPIHFIKYFIWPNANKYFAPPIEFMGIYSSGSPVVTGLSNRWFHLTSSPSTHLYRLNVESILNIYPILSGVINLLFCFLLFMYLSPQKIKNRTSLTTIILITSTFWFINALFSIGSVSAALRFQSFPILITSVSATLLLAYYTGDISEKKKFYHKE